MHALAITAAVHECWEFWIEDVLISEEHPHLLDSSLVEEKSQLLFQGSMHIASGFPEFVHPMTNPVFRAIFLYDRPFPESDTRPGLQMIPDLGVRLEGIIGRVELYPLLSAVTPSGPGSEGCMEHSGHSVMPPVGWNQRYRPSRYRTPMRVQYQPAS